MRKYIICLILIYLGLGIYAQDIGKNQIRFGLISAKVYELDLRLSSQLGRIIVTTEFTVNSDSLVAADYYSIFLNQDAKIEQVFINNQLISPTIATNLQVEHFVPNMPVPALLDTSSVIVCYSFKKADVISQTGVTSFKVKYWIPLPEWHPNVDGSSIVGFLSDYYWYPRNIENESKVSIKLQSSSSYRIELDEPCIFTEDKGISTHRGCFQDGPGKSSYLKIIKKLN